MGTQLLQEARTARTMRPEARPEQPPALEARVREMVAMGLPKLAVTSLAGSFPMGFAAQWEQSRDYRVASQVVCSQLLYTRNLQLLTLLVMDPALVMKLGLRAFPKLGRAEAPKMAISACGEALNAMVSKLGCLAGKLDDDS